MARQNDVALLESHGYYLLGRCHGYPKLTKKILGQARQHIKFLTNPRNRPFFGDPDFSNRVCAMYQELATYRRQFCHPARLEYTWNALICSLDCFEEYLALLKEVGSEQDFFFQVYSQTYYDLTKDIAQEPIDGFEVLVASLQQAHECLAQKKRRLYQLFRLSLAVVKRQTHSVQPGLADLCDIYARHAHTFVSLDLTIQSLESYFETRFPTKSAESAFYIWTCHYVFRFSKDPIINERSLNQGRLALGLT